MKYILLLYSSLITFQSFAQNWSQVSRVFPEADVVPEDQFGESIDVYDDIAIVGVPKNDLLDDNAGIVYIFSINDDNWINVAELTPSDPEANDGFGSSVAIYENTIIVSSLDKSVYLFEKPQNGWEDAQETAILRESDKDGYTEFGKSIAIHGDTIVIGAPFATGSISSSGAVYLYVKPTDGWAYENFETAKLYESNPTTSNSTGRFGNSVAIYNSTVVAGSPNFDSTFLDQGAILVFEKSGSNWSDMTETAKLVDVSPGNNNYLGSSVSIYGDTIFCAKLRNAELDEGSGHIYIKPSAGWVNNTEDAKLSVSLDFGDQIFSEVNVELTENIAVLTVSEQYPIGSASAKTYTGLGFVYQKGSGNWIDTSEDAVLKASDSLQNFRLGSSIALSQSRILLGSPGDNTNESSGSIFIYTSEGDWSGNLIENDRFAWTSELTLSAENDKFGTSVAISGNYAVAGSPYDDQVNINAGAAYVFKKSGDSWERIAKLTASDGTLDDQFGTEVAIYNDLIAIGVPNHDAEFFNQGAVYIYKRPTSGWSDLTESQKIVAPITEYEGYFGASIDIHKDLMVVGGYYAGSSIFKGQAVLYKYFNDHFLEIAELSLSVPSEINQFGMSVDVFEDQVIVASGIPTKPFIYVKPETGWEDMTESATLLLSDFSPTCYKCKDKLAVQITDSIALCGYPNLQYVDIPGKVSGRIFKHQPVNQEWISNTSQSSLLASRDTKGESFSSSIGLSGDWLIAGNFFDSTDNKRSGKAYFFSSVLSDTSGQINENQYVVAETTSDEDDFGFDVSISGSTAIIGAPGESNETGPDAGSVYFFSSGEASIISVHSVNNGIFKTRDTVLIDVQFDREVQIIDKPLLVLFINDSTVRSATYRKQISPTEIRMQYIVNDGDVSSSLDYLNENSFLYGGTITDTELINANRVLPPIGAEASLAGSSSIILDADKPFPFFSGPKKASETFEVIIEFSRDLDEITIDDLSVQNGSIESSEIRNDSIFAIISPDKKGDIILFYKEGAFFDFKGTPNDSIGFVVEYDTIPPEISITSEISTLTNKPFEIKITFSEAIDDVTENDVGLINATSNYFTASDDTLYLEVNPEVDGMVVVFYRNNSIFDLAGNGNDSTSFSIEYDATPPVISITSDAEDYINSSFETSVVFNEEVDDIDENDISLINATLSDFLVGEGSASFLVNPMVDGEVLVYYPNNQVFDLAGNGNDSTSFSIEYDATPPVISITSDAEDYINSSFETSVVFNEEVDTIDKNDVRLINATLSDFLVGEGSASFLVNPLEEGEVLVYYPNNQVFDLAGNGNDSSAFSIEYDATPPVLSMTSEAEEYINSSFEISVAFNEEVDNIDENDISLINATLSDFLVDEGLASFLVNPLEEGEVLVYYPNNQVFDLAGNGNDSSAFSIEYDATPPVLSMTSEAEEYINSSFEISVAFNEEVDNIEEHDIRLINATLSDFLVGEGSASFLVNPLVDGEVLVYYPNNQVFDLAGNGNDSTSLAMIYDVTPPMLNTEIKSGDLTAENFEIYLKFSEFVTDFNESDISLKNLTLTNLIKENDSLYSITLERVQFGEIVLRIESDSYLDRAGNWNVEIHEITELILKTSEIVDQIKAYPVPSNGFLDIHSQIKSISEIAMTIYSIGGKIISEGKVLNGRNSYDLRSLDDGIYFIHFEYNGKTQIQKIIIKK